MLAAFRAFGEDTAVTKHTSVTTLDNQIEVVCEADQRFTGNSETRVYTKNVGKYTISADMVRIRAPTGNIYLGHAYSFFVDRPEGVIGVGFDGRSIQCDRGFFIPDDLSKKGSLAIWDAYEAGSLSRRDVSDSQSFELPFHISVVFDLADADPSPKPRGSIRSITLKDNRVTVEVHNERKSHVGLVVFDASKWPWSIVEAWIDGNQIDLVEEKRALLKNRKDGLPIFVRPLTSPTDGEWMKGSPETTR